MRAAAAATAFFIFYRSAASVENCIICLIFSTAGLTISFFDRRRVPGPEMPSARRPWASVRSNFSASACARSSCAVAFAAASELLSLVLLLAMTESSPVRVLPIDGSVAELSSSSLRSPRAPALSSSSSSSSSSSLPLMPSSPLLSLSEPEIDASSASYSDLLDLELRTDAAPVLVLPRPDLNRPWPPVPPLRPRPKPLFRPFPKAGGLLPSW